MRYNMARLRNIADAKRELTKIRATGYAGMIGLVCLDHNGDLIILRQKTPKHAMVKRIIAKYAEVKASREAAYLAQIRSNGSTGLRLPC